jgi:GT2 family glycosyltransferase
VLDTGKGTTGAPRQTHRAWRKRFSRLPENLSSNAAKLPPIFRSRFNAVRVTVAKNVQKVGFELYQSLHLPPALHRRVTSLVYLVGKPFFFGTHHYDAWAKKKERSKTPKLHDYLLDRHGVECCHFIEELMGIVNRFEADPLGYEKSFGYQGLWHSLRQEKARCNDAVDVSIVVPIFNNIGLTLTCLAAVLNQKTRYSYEILVGDDASSDSGPEILGQVRGHVRYLRYNRNLGFLKNCNRVARKARGRYLVFLNNDTLPLPGWLDELIQPFLDVPRVGLTGSKLLNSDGTLQEAGGILWRDGSAWNFGRNRDPRSPEFNYVKEVDYCSGASIAVPKRLWNKLGGFDPVFHPGYCEDSDLALRIRKLGYKVVYQPFSEVIHHEGRSHGRDVSSGLKSYQVRNQKKLFNRWSKVLKQHPPNGQHVYIARDRSANKPHVLFVDNHVPQFDRDAGSRTIWSYLNIFRDAGFRVTFWPHNRHPDPIYTAQLERLGIEVLYSVGSGPSFKSWFSAAAPWIKYVFLSRPDVATKYIDVIRRRGGAKILFYGHDLHWRRLQKEFEVLKDDDLLSKSRALKSLEESVCARSDAVFYPSAEECALIRQECERNAGVYALPAYCYSRGALQRARKNLLHCEERRDLNHLLFVGGFKHPPNVDGILWFAQKVFPILDSIRDQFRLTVVGSNTPEPVQVLASQNIRVLGQVSDSQLEALYSTVGIAVVPLRFGAGVKGKVIEAFANGVPVVSTTVGMQGINCSQNIAFVADEPDDFAEQIRLAASDRRLAQKKARNALDFVERNYSAASIRDILSQEVIEFRGKAEAITAREPN